MEILGLNHHCQSFILLINVKMPTIVGILTFMSRINFMLSRVENGKKFYNLGSSSAKVSLQLCTEASCSPLISSSPAGWGPYGMLALTRDSPYMYGTGQNPDQHSKTCSCTLGVQRRMISVVIFFYFEIIIFCFVVAICDQVHDVETIFHPFLCANSIWKSFRKYE